VIDHGPGLSAVTWVAALVTLAGLAIALYGARLHNISPSEVADGAACTT